MEVTGGGSFVELVRATGSRSLLRRRSSAVNFKLGIPPPATGADFTLGQLLSRQPALQEHYLRWTSETDCVPLVIDADPGSPQAYLKLQKYGKSHLTKVVGDRIFEGTPFQFVQEDAEVFMYQGPHNFDDLPGLSDWPDANILSIGDLWVVGMFPSQMRLSKIAALFALSYALGMLVRYFPTQWTALVRGQIEDAALPTLAAAVELIEASFPATIVDFLEEKPL